MASSRKPSLLLLRYTLVLLLFVSLFATSYARVLKSHARVITKRCDFDSIYSFGEGSSSVSNGLVSSAFNVPFPFSYKNADFVSGASFAVPGATVMNPSFFVKTRIQPPPAQASLQSQINNFVNLLGARLIMPYQERAKKLQGALFFINQPGITDYEQAFLQGKSMTQVSRLVPEIVSTIKNQIRKLIFAGASNVLVSGVPRLASIPGFRKLLRNPNGLNTFGLFHNDHLQQALVELKLEFPEAHIVYADYYKMNERGFSQSALEFAKARRCNYFQLGDLSYLRREVLLV